MLKLYIQTLSHCDGVTDIHTVSLLEIGCSLSDAQIQAQLPTHNEG